MFDGVGKDTFLPSLDCLQPFGMLVNFGNASGPPPRGLFHCAWRLQSGRLEIQAPHYPTLQDPLVQNA